MMAWHPHWTQYLSREHWTGNFVSGNRDILGVVGELSVIPPIEFGINSKNIFVRKEPNSDKKIFLSEKNPMVRFSKNTIADYSEQLDLSWQPQRAFVVSLMCTICIEGLPRQFDALLVRLYQQSMLIFAMVALGHPKSALELFQRLREFSHSFE